MSNLPDILKHLKTEINELIQEKEYSKILNKIDDLHKQIIHQETSQEEYNSEYYCKKLFEHSLSGFGIANLNGDIIDCNPALLKILGFDKLESLKKHNIKEFYGDHSERKKLINELDENGYVKEFKIKIKTNDERIITALISANLVKNGLNDPIVIVNFVDISEQERFERDLIENENYLDLILNSVNSGILLIDPETHKIIDINKYALKILNYQKDDVIGKECFQFICPTEKGKCPVTDLNKKVEDSVRELIIKEGERRYILKNVKEIKILGKSYLLETFADIHEQKQIEDELKTLNEELERRVIERTLELSDSEEKFRTLFQSSRDAIMLLTIEGFFDCNQATLDIFGFSKKDEFLKQHPGTISPEYQPNGEKSTDLSNKYITQAMHGEIPIFEWEHLRKNGEVFTVEVLLSPITLGGQKAVHAVVRDISERKKAEIEISKSEEKFRKLAELSPSGISIQRKNKYFYVNSAWAEITGYGVEEIDKVGPFDIIHRDMRKYVWKFSEDKLRKEGAKLRYDLKIITKQKKIKWLDISITTINFENQNATFAICNDITEVREIQGALKLSEEKFRRLTELSPAAICIQTTEKFLWANPAWSEISGYPHDEVLNMGPLDVIHPDMQDIARKRSDARLDKEDVITRYNLKILTKDKKAKWVDVALSVIEFEGQTASLAVSTDITKTIEAQQALKESEGKYRSLIENLKHEYFFYRHNINGVFEYVSPSIKNILGYSQKDFLTHYTNYLTDNPVNIKAVKKTELSIKGIQQKPYELEIFDSENNIHILQVSESPLFNENNKVIAVEGIVHDITKQKKAEETIKDQLKEIQIYNEEIKSINEEIHAVNDDLERRIEDINRLNENLKISENKFRTLVGNIPGIVYRCLLDKDWTMQFISKEIETFTGYRASDFINNNVRTFASIIHPDDREMVETGTQSGVDENRSYMLEYRIVHKNGDIKWVYEKGQGVFNDYNEVLMLDGVILDITEQKEIEEKLEQERKFSTGIINGTPSIICGIKPDGSTNYINPAGEQITGYKSEELIGKNWWKILYPGEEYQQVEQLFIDFEKGDVRNYEMTLTTKEGEKRIVAWNSINYYDEKGNIIEVIGFGNDITERKKADQALKESEELYQKLVNNQGEGIGIVDSFETFVFANPAAHKIFGVTTGSLVGRNMKEFLSEEQYNKMLNQTENRKKGITNTYELEILRPDKTKRILLITVSPEYNKEKEITGAFAIFRDITERKIVEETLFESEKKLRASNAQKDKFFSLLAHDLRSPIGNFLQISELLKLNYEELSKDQMHGFFDNLHSLADGTFKLLENLLMWSRSQLGRLEIETKAIELYKVVEDVAYLFEENLKSKSIQFKNDLPHDLIVMADLNIIQTLFRNLISNAIKFSYPGGNITVGSKMEIDKLNNSEYYIISVKDTGVGIPEDKLEKIFDMNEYYTTLGTESEKGTGLGLILCKELIEKNGGKIWVESEEENLPAGRQGGSTFCFTLRR